jgi:hypothetical protein
MNLKNRLTTIFCALLLTSSFSGKLLAEGTHELSPAATDSAMLATNLFAFGDFASYTSLWDKFCFENQDQ